MSSAAGAPESELAKRTGTTRKALRLYEAAGLIAADRRTGVLPSPRYATSSACAAQAERHEHVRTLIDTRLINLERALADLKAARDELTAIRKARRKRALAAAAVCPHIERMK
jgi:hypothetical protein